MPSNRKPHKPHKGVVFRQENMIFPSNVMKVISQEYVDLFRVDKTARILPLLSSCHMVSGLVIPLLYREIELVNARQMESFLHNVCPESLTHLRFLETKCPCYNRVAIEKFDERLLEYRKGILPKVKRQGRSLDRMSMNVEEVVFFETEHIARSLIYSLNPVSINCWRNYIDQLYLFGRQGRCSRLKRLGGIASCGSLRQFLLQPFSLDVLHVKVIGREELTEWKRYLQDVLNTKKIKKYILLEFEAYEHVFCFEGETDDAKATDLEIVLKRGCSGVACLVDRTGEPLSEEERAIRDTFRPGWEALSLREDYDSSKGGDASRWML